MSDISIHRDPAKSFDRVACPCCGYRTLDNRGDDEICPVCYWQDDGQEDTNAGEVWGGPNGDLSLAQARKNFVDFGACEKRFATFVRPPTSGERQPNA